MKIHRALSACRFLALAALFLGLAPAGAFAEEVRKDFSHTFFTEPGMVFHLEHEDGRVTVTPWERDEIRVEVVYEADIKKLGIGGSRDFTVHFRQEGRDAWVRVQEPGSGVTFGLFAIEVHRYEYTIQAPPWVELDIDGDDGDVSIEGWRGPVAIDTEDGDIRLRDLEAEWVRITGDDGDLLLEDFRSELEVELEDGNVVLEEAVLSMSDIQLDDGDLRARNCEGNFRIRLEDGDVDFDRVAAGDLSIRTEDGTTSLRLVAGAEPMRAEIESEDGDVKVDLDPRLPVLVEVRSRDGRIRADLPSATGVESKDSFFTGRLGDGSGTLRIRTSDGMVRVAELASF